MKNLLHPLAATIPTGSLITTTAILAASASEFSGVFEVTAATVITNRQRTYRVKRN